MLRTWEYLVPLYSFLENELYSFSDLFTQALIQGFKKIENIITKLLKKVSRTSFLIFTLIF